MVGLIGPVASGKTLFALNLAVKNAMKNKKILLISLRESRDTILYKLKKIGGANSLMNIEIKTINPFTLPLSTVQCKLDEYYQREKPDILIIDGLETYLIAYGMEEFYSYVYQRVNYLKSLSKLVIVTMTLSSINQTVGIEQLGDYLIQLDIIEKDGELKRRLRIIKSLDPNKEAEKQFYLKIIKNGLVIERSS